MTSPGALGGGRERLARLERLVAAHQGLFWTLHSVWAVGWGVAFLAVGTRNPDVLRYGLASLFVVWATGLALPAALETTWIPPRRREAARKLVLYGQKWLLQGLSWFVIPLYHRSATYPSRNALFMALLVVAALAATIDVVYDEVVTRRPWLLGLFLSFSAFSCVNLTLPMIWRVGGLWNLAASGALATAVFTTFWRQARRGSRGGSALAVAAVGLGFFLVVTLGRAFVPPAPLRLVSVSFGTSLAPSGLDVATPLSALPPSGSIRLFAVAAIQAPAGLTEGVRHTWSVDGETVAVGRLIDVAGGRALGFRSRSTALLRGLRPGQVVRLEVETAWGQLIGRARIPVRG